jgi:hypothetical protein
MRDAFAIVVLGILCLALIGGWVMSTRWFLLERVSAEMLVSDTMRYAYEGREVGRKNK